MASDERVYIRVRDDEKQAFTAGAREDELSLSEWFRWLATRRLEELAEQGPEEGLFVPGAGLGG